MRGENGIWREVLSPTACGRSPLTEGAKAPCLPL